MNGPSLKDRPVQLLWASQTSHRERKLAVEDVTLPIENPCRSERRALYEETQD
jgi:hypothetical protein